MPSPLDSIAGIGSGVVALGLLSALSWGAADFGGGLTSRRVAVLGVVLFSQLVGMVLSASLALVRAEPVPSPIDVGWSAAAGAFGAIGILSLYRGLAAGRMGVVAPITGVLGASVPIAVGIVLEGWPSPLVLAGVVLAFVAVVLVSTAVEAGESRRPAGLEYALVAGLAIGLFNVTISRLPDGIVFGPLTLVRLTGATVFLSLIVARGAGWRIDRRAVVPVIVIGLLDMAGNAFFVMAAQAGPLAVAAILSSLYPVGTVVLATIVLRERLSGVHALGIAAALAAIVMIGSGS